MTTVNLSKPVLLFALRLFLAAFGLNWIWENAQMYFYRSDQEAWREFGFCTIAAVGDALLTLLAFAAGAAFCKNARQVVSGSRLAYLALALFGAAAAAVIERFALAAGLWAYGDRMVRIPLLEVGLIPVIQLTLLMPAALWLAIRSDGFRSSAG